MSYISIDKDFSWIELKYWLFSCSVEALTAFRLTSGEDELYGKNSLNTLNLK